MTDRTISVGDTVLANVGVEPTHSTVVGVLADRVLVKVPGIDQPVLRVVSDFYYEPKKPWLESDRWVLPGDARESTHGS